MSSATDTVLDAAAALSEDAPAKVNLALHVTGRRGDGYHLLDTLAVFTGFGDRITVAPSEADFFTVTGRYASGVPKGADNLVIGARDIVRGLAPKPCQPVEIALQKSIPAASGIGGGSSDAAATIRALARHWHLDLSAEVLATAALSLGADLPMCLAARPLIARGIGEAITPLPSFPALDMVLVNPGVEVATPAVFSALTRPDGLPLPPLPDSLSFTALLEWLASTRNDLEPAAISIAPVIGDVLSSLDQAGAAFARMSGSGATCFGLFEDAASAARAAAAISSGNPGWFVTATKSGSAA